MTELQFKDTVDELKKRGYKLCQWHEQPCDDGCDYYYKVITRTENKYGESRASVQLMFKIWSFRQYRNSIPEMSLYSLEPVVCVSREVDELMDLHLSHPDRSIDELEKIAKKFGEWAFKHLDLPVTKED